MLTDDETAEQDELEEQLWTATEELQRAVMRLFQDRDIHPHLVVLALARVTGEVGAGTAGPGQKGRAVGAAWCSGGFRAEHGRDPLGACPRHPCPTWMPCRPTG